MFVCVYVCLFIFMYVHIYIYKFAVCMGQHIITQFVLAQCSMSLYVIVYYSLLKSEIHPKP